MHPFTLSTYGRTVVHSRASRRARRARRAVIAVVFGLLGGGGSAASADPPQQQLKTPRGPEGWHQWQAPKHAHLPGSHAGTHGRTLPDPDDGSALDWQLPAVIAMSGVPALVLLRRRRRLHVVA
jgi:hypothetical protein